MAKITNLGCFHPKPYLKTPKEKFLFDQNDCWGEIIEGETRVDNLRCGAAVVTKIEKKTPKIIKGCKTTKTSFKNIKIEIFRVILTCDRRFNPFDLKKNNKTLYSRSHF